MIPAALSGVFAALPTPYREDGTPDLDRLLPLVDFLLDHEIGGFCAGGATGEYAACSVEERIKLYQTIARRLSGRASLILGVGGEHFGHVKRLARAAADCGATAALLPPPLFFRFCSQDLLGFLRRAAAEIPLPVLVYNIPQFTRELDLENLLGLAGSEGNIVGIKESSGRRANLQAIGKARAIRPLAFLIGSDELLLEALEHGADGAISGTASAFPELIRLMYEAFKAGRTEPAWLLKSLLDEFLTRTVAFPPPWVVKLALGARGLDMGGLSWPLNGPLRGKTEELRKWLPGWITQCEAACAEAASLVPRSGRAR